ncbi:MAG: MerR family transcriptional regulator [Actinomycetota bacterium]
MAKLLRIAEVADRAGVSTAAIRYYERIGVLDEPERAANGYRTYDDRTVEQLRFVGRAKQLGCSLEEIAELMKARESGTCGPVQDRLRVLVADKIAAAEAEMVELAALTADLRLAVDALAGHRPVGPCDETCGCVTSPPADDTPLGCTLPSEEIPDRLATWHTLLRGASRTEIGNGVRIELTDTGIDVGEVARLAAAEQACCGFFVFRLTVDRRGTGLEITAPPDALDAVHTVFGGPGASAPIEAATSGR